MKLIDGFEVTQAPNGMYVAKAVGDRAKEFPQGIQMGLSGAFLWDQLLQEDCTRTELIFRLENFYECDVDTDQIAADVDLFTGFLRDNGLLVE